MSLNLSGTDLLGLGNLVNSVATATTSTSSATPLPATSSTSINDLLSKAVASGSNSYVQSSLTRGEALGTPTPVVPMITLEEFINQLVIALAELFRARGYERIADYLLTQHDLDAVFGQLAVRMLAIYNQSQRRESLIQKYLRINAGAADLLTEEQQDLTFSDTPDTVLSMSSGQLNELNELLNGYSDSNGNHIGLNSIVNQAEGAVLNAPITALETDANAGQLLAPDDALVKSGINTAVSLAQKMETEINNNNPQFALIANSASNTSATNDTNNLETASQSLLASSYTNSSTVNALSDLNGIVTSATSGATPLFPPLYQSGTSYSWNAFVTYGYQVYQCTNQNGSSGSPVSDPSSWTNTGSYPAGSAYQMNELTSIVSSDVAYMQANGETNFSNGTSYTNGQNVLYSNNPYYSTQNLSYDALQAGSFPSNDAVSYQGNYYLNSSGNPIKVTQLTPGTSYSAGDLVAYNGQIYKATTSGTYYPVGSASSFATYSYYSQGQFVNYYGDIYKVIANTGNMNMNFYSATVPSGVSNPSTFYNYTTFFSPSGQSQSSGIKDYGNVVGSYSIPQGMFANVKDRFGSYYYLPAGNVNLKPTNPVIASHSNTNDLSYTPYSGNGDAAFNSFGSATLSVAGRQNTESYIQCALADNSSSPACLYQGGIHLSIIFNVGAGNPDNISFNIVSGNNPTADHGVPNYQPWRSYGNGTGTTGLSLVIAFVPDVNNSPVNELGAYRFNNITPNIAMDQSASGSLNFNRAQVALSPTLAGLQSGDQYLNIDIDANGNLTANLHNKSAVVGINTNLNNTGQNPAPWTPDQNYSLVIGQGIGSNTSTKIIKTCEFYPYSSCIENVVNFGVITPDQNTAIFSHVGTAASTLSPDTAGSNFTSYSPANDSANWTTYSPSADSSRWTAGASPTLLAKQAELQTLLPPLQSLFNTANFTPGLRQDLLDLCQGSANQTVFPTISTFYPTQAALLAYQQYVALFTTWTNQLNQSSPNYTSVQSSAQAMQTQINNQISSSSLSDSTQYWAQIQTQLSSLISACSNSNQSAALAAIGPTAPTPDNDPNGTALATLMVNQYSLLDTSNQWDYITANIPLSGVVNLDSSPLLAMIEQIQDLQGYITRIQQGDTSIPAAQFFNLMKNTLENVYDYQPLTGTAVFSQGDYTSDQNLLANAMLLRGSGSITVNESLQTAENLGVNSVLGATLLGLYRDIYQATGNTSGYNQVNAFLASQAPAQTGFQGYLAQGGNSLSTLANYTGNGLNTTAEATGMNATKHLGGFIHIYHSSRKATKDSGWLSLKNAYDQNKGLLPAALQGVNTDLLFAADQYVGDNYIAGSKSQVAQRVYYNGQFYKAITSSYDSPTTGVNTGSWELMNWNPNRSANYVFGDMVFSNGLMYRCLSDHQPSSAAGVTPGNVLARNSWACLNFQPGYTYLPGDTVLVASGNGAIPFTPYVALVKYRASNTSDLSNANIWQAGYNNAVTLNGSSPNAAATLGGMTAVVNGSNTNFNPSITSGQINSNYSGNVSAGTIFSTLLNAQNAATSTPFTGWCDVTNQSIATNTSNAVTSGGTATTFDGMQIFNPALTLATQVMETLQMLDLFFYAHQRFTVAGGGNYYTGYNCPMIALTFGTADSGGNCAFEVTFSGQSNCFHSTDVRNIYGVTNATNHNMGQTYGNSGWSAGQLSAANNFYSAARSLAGQLKNQVSNFQNTYNNMILAVQQETYRLLAQSFINTIDLEASLKRLFRNAPLSDDEKKLLAKILAVILSLLVAILGSDPQIQDAFTTQSVSSLSATNAKNTETQWTFNSALSNVTISQTFANDIIAKAIALANEMLSEKSRSSSISDDRLTTQNYLNMNALIKGQQDALGRLDAQTTDGTTYV